MGRFRTEAQGCLSRTREAAVEAMGRGRRTHPRDAPPQSVPAPTGQRDAHERTSGMALAARLDDREPPANGTPCSVAVALAQLPAEDLEVFQRLLGSKDRPGASSQTIYDVMQDERRDLFRAASLANENGDRAEAARLQDLAAVYDVKYQTIGRHRGGRCRCARGAA